jgi:glycosyltransferase involved in cell wall biosynthesis
MTAHLPHVVLDALLVNTRPTGVGRSILELTKAMSQVRWEMQFTLLVTTPQLFLWLDDCPEWTVHHCPGACGGTLRKAFFTQFKIPSLCRILGADLFHSLQFVAPMNLSCPNVVTVHDLAWLRFPRTVEEPRRTYYRLMVPRTLQRAAAVVANSEATVHDVVRYYPQCRDVSVTPFGTPSWVWEQTSTPQVAHVGRPFFLFVGTLEPRKNLENIIAAFSQLLLTPLAKGAKCWPSLVLVGGKGWKDSSLRRLMEPLTLSGDLDVLDYCDIPKLRQLYHSAQALLFPSLHEGFGFPILEAMAFELPVITSGVGAMAEVAGQNALLVDPENVDELCGAMTQNAGSKDLRARLGAAGPARSRQWSWDHTAASTVAVYRRVLK